MSVEIEIISPSGGGAAIVTVFTDSLIGTDQPFGIGDSWIPAFNLTNPPIGGSTTGIDFAGNVNRGGLGLSMIGVIGFSPVGFGIPTGLDYTHVLNANQFAQLVPVSIPGGISRIGPMCYCVPNAVNYYTALFESEVSQYSVRRVTGVVSTTLVASSPATAFVAGDTVRLEVDVTTTPGTTIIRSYVNGVLQTTTNDNSASRLTTGVVGIQFGGGDPGTTFRVSDFSGGKL